MKGKLKIAQVAPLYESVPPQRYGGTERVVKTLVDGLASNGHEVTLFATGDSTTTTRLISPCPYGLRLDKNVVDKVVPHITMLKMLCEIESHFDLIHFHTDYLHLPLVSKLKTPSLTTIHSRLDRPELIAMYERFKDVSLVSISHSQAQPLASNNWVQNVYHGIDKKIYVPKFEQGRHLTFLGRMSPDKNPEDAIKIAIESELPIKIAAKIDPEDQTYYQERIMPFLKHPLVEFVGEVGEIKKVELLRDSIALIFPIQWPEPFGMVLIESMACGTPVLAYNNGSVPEVIDEGITGIVVDRFEDALKKIRAIDTLDRRLVRRRFEERFDQSVMVQNYEKVYDQLLNVTPKTTLDSPII